MFLKTRLKHAPPRTLVPTPPRPQDRIVWAAGMVVDYLHKTWAQALLASFNLSLTDIDAATQKKEKTKGSEVPSAGGAASSSAASAASSRPREGESDAGNSNKKAKVAAGSKVCVCEYECVCVCVCVEHGE